MWCEPPLHVLPELTVVEELGWSTHDKDVIKPLVQLVGDNLIIGGEVHDDGWIGVGIAVDKSTILVINLAIVFEWLVKISELIMSAPMTNKKNLCLHSGVCAPTRRREEEREEEAGCLFYLFGCLLMYCTCLDACCLDAFVYSILFL